MDKLINIIKAIYGDGFSFKKEMTIPWINTKVTGTILIKSKNPTKFTFTANGSGGKIKFDQNGPQITIREVSLQTTLTGIDLSEDRVVFELSGFPDITYTF